jgi:hypothetical protein
MSKLSNFKYKFNNIAEALGYNIYYGARSNFNSKRTVNENQIIIEPFKNVSLENSDACSTDLTVTIWLGEKRNRNEAPNVKQGDDLEAADLLRDQLIELYDEIQASDDLLIIQLKRNITTNYYEAEGNATINNQNYITATLKFRMY